MVKKPSEQELQLTELGQQLVSLKKTVQTLMILVIVLVLVIGGYIVYKETQPNFSQQVAVAPQAAAPANDAPYEVVTQYPKLTNNDKFRTSKNAKYVVIEYSDYECPFCKRFHETGLTLMKEYGSDITWVHRNYPLPFHPRALPSAVMGECVNKLAGSDAFWKYTDKVFAMQGTAEDALADEKLLTYAVEAGASKDALTQCITDTSIETAIKAESKTGSDNGISGTPGIFILNQKNGKVVLLKGAMPLETFKAAIEKIS